MRPRTVWGFVALLPVLFPAACAPVRWRLHPTTYEGRRRIGHVI